MHAVMTITARHDRFVSASPNSEKTAIEAYHSYQSAALFNQKLSTPIQPSDRDAILATAIILGSVAVSSIKSSSPEETWPLKSSSSSDLQWLRFSDGKKVIWGITNPLRPESIFHVLAEDYGLLSDAAQTPEPLIQNLPSQLLNLCDIDNTSNINNNPYYTALQVLATVLNIPCNPSTILKFLAFITKMQPDYLRLLELKDPRALLLMALWYAQVCHYQWWLATRARLECRAICTYLERFHPREAVIQDLLQLPKFKLWTYRLA